MNELAVLIVIVTVLGLAALLEAKRPAVLDRIALVLFPGLESRYERVGPTHFSTVVMGQTMSLEAVERSVGNSASEEERPST